MKNILVIAILFSATYFISPITFILTDNTDDPLKMQINIEAGVGINGSVSSGIGKKDYNIVHFRPSFYIERFGFGFDLSFRFANFPGLFEFNKSDWDFSNLSDTMKLYKLSDKFDFTIYGSPDYFIYGKSGVTPYITAGSGLLINSLSNRSFSPSAKEHGLYTIFNGEKYKIPIPLRCYFFATDIVDPDIFVSGGDFDFGTFIPLDNLSLIFGTHIAFDIDSAESNYLSATTLNDIKYYRNTDKSGTTAGLSLPIEVSYSMEQVRFRVSNEFSAVTKSNKVELANMAGFRVDMININNSGYILGIPFGIIVKTPGYYPGYFSVNYETVRGVQYTEDLDKRNLFFRYGFHITALKEQFLLSFLLTSPFEMEYYAAIYDGSLVFNGIKNTVIRNLQLAVKYRAAFSELNIYGSGGYFFYSITKKFRFSVEINYNLYGTKLSFIAGVQSPNWVNSMEETFVTEDLTKTKMVVLDSLGNLMEKFMRLEVSFVF